MNQKHENIFNNNYVNVHVKYMSFSFENKEFNLKLKKIFLFSLMEFLKMLHLFNLLLFLHYFAAKLGKKHSLLIL